MDGKKKLKAVLAISIILLCAAVGSFVYGLVVSVGAYKEQTHNPDNILIDFTGIDKTVSGSNAGKLNTHYVVTNKTASDGLIGVEAEIEYYSDGKRIYTMIVTFSSSSSINRGSSRDFNVETTVLRSSGNAGLIALFDATGNISIKYTITRARFTDWTSPYGNRYSQKSGGASGADKQNQGSDSKEPNVTAAHVHTAGNGGKYSFNNEKHWLVCSGCGQTYDFAIHTFGEWAIIKAASATAEGNRERSCTVCGYKQAETIAKLAHKHSWSTSWKSDKTNHWHACSGCSEKNATEKHTFGSWITTIEATETSTGSRYRVCKICNYKETETIAKIKGNGLVYELSGNGQYYIVSGIGTYKKTTVEILDNYNGLPVKEVGNCAFEGCNQIKEVKLGKNITTLGYSCFVGCNNLEKVTFNSSLKTIGDSAFYLCNIKTLSIPSSVTTIGRFAFGSNKNLSSIASALSAKKIGDNAFANCKKLSGTINISNSVTEIGYNAFTYTSIQRISFGTKLKELPIGIIQHCEELEYVYIPKNITVISSNFMSNDSVAVTEIKYGGTMDEWYKISFIDDRDNNIITYPENIGLGFLRQYDIVCTDGIIPKKG